MIHKSVLSEELIENLNLKPGMTVVDATLGAGGHSETVLKEILPGGRLISIDLDKKAVINFEKKIAKGISIAKKELMSVRSVPANIHKKNGDQSFNNFLKLGNRKGEIVGGWHGAADNYANIKEITRGLGIKSVDAVFVDLGFSSDQIEDPARGFSFLRNGPLDMRYSPDEQKETAADIVGNYTEKELAKIFREFGEEKFSKRIAREIEKRRKIGRIKETQNLVEIVLSAIPKKFRQSKIHPATKVFQTLRIETNKELENLKKFLIRAEEVLASQGTLAVISFHSLEDRIVKNFFRDEAKGCVCPPNFPKCVCGQTPRLEVLTKKPIVASKKEAEENPRSRSAKLRIARKI